jgi:hypothetical protein
MIRALAWIETTSDFIIDEIIIKLKTLIKFGYHRAAFRNTLKYTI